MEQKKQVVHACTDSMQLLGTPLILGLLKKEKSRQEFQPASQFILPSAISASAILELAIQKKCRQYLRAQGSLLDQSMASVCFLIVRSCNGCAFT
jgi:hypothetical protein